jgi:predicted metal-binding membrane protein
MKTRKVIVCGLLAGLASFIVGTLLYMNPLTSGIYAANVSPCARSMELFGGTMYWLLFMLAGGLVSAVFLAVLYSYTEKGLSIRPVWKKGLFFGFLLWLVMGLPQAYNTWLLYDFSTTLIMVETFNGLIGGLTAGVVLAWLWARLK